MTLVQVDSIQKKFDGFSILTNATFQIKTGERVGLVGSNGGGESTLMRILAGNLSSNSGKIHRIHQSTTSQISDLSQELECDLTKPLHEHVGDISPELLSRFGIHRKMLQPN